MKFEYDKSADSAYIYLEDTIADGEAAQTIELKENISIDLDKDGKLLGIEILNASTVLHKSSLVNASSV